ncbi:MULTISPECIES: hypothetical protein [unclassified Aureispira]|uniref:hypothetical protein n=1 Tax=unclassified Aureispira TaxID=2649989 RepID=UPI000695C523|nr:MULTISPECIES: hypothetical protein [unclassified Aureispira]WMX14844.1 hypothetical protein QP953_00500 [Aureispira sp. CCB-E]
MTIHIFKIFIRFFLFSLLSVLFVVLVSFQSRLPTSSPKPQIKTQIHKTFELKNNEAILQKHTETKYNIHGEIIEQAEYTETDLGKAALEKLKIIKYNVEGLYIGNMVYNRDNALIWSEENEYDETDHVIKITHTDYIQPSNSTYTTLVYDDEDRVVLSKTYNQADNQLSEQKRTYSATGELLSAIDWSYTYQNSKSIKKTISLENQYNNKGQIVQSTLLSQIGKNRLKDIKLFKNNAIIDWIKYKNGRIVSQFTAATRDTTAIIKEYAIPPPIPEQRIVLEYDDAKRDPLENIPHTPFKTVTYKTNKYGLPSKKITRTYNQVSEVVYYFYNDKEELVSEKTHNKISRDTDEVKYEYDSYSNPVKKMIFHNEKQVQEHLYRYEYYGL